MRQQTCDVITVVAVVTESTNKGKQRSTDVMTCTYSMGNDKKRPESLTRTIAGMRVNKYKVHTLHQQCAFNTVIAVVAITITRHYDDHQLLTDFGGVPLSVTWISRVAWGDVSKSRRPSTKILLPLTTKKALRPMV